MVLTLDDFKQKVVESSGIVFVEFYASWCPHCQAFMPEWDQISQNLASQAQFFQVEIDNSPDLAEAYGVQNIPTIKVFVNGQVVQTLLGAQPQSVFEQLIKENS
ncbi:MAG: thioredoxin family protein [Eubacteriaceae bacterium]|jgi:thioredoxin 1